MTAYNTTVPLAGIVIETHGDEYRNLLPPRLVQRVQDVLVGGARRGHHGFERGTMTVEECLQHAADHAQLRRDGDQSEDHLLHEAVRLLMALAIRDGMVVPVVGFEEMK